MQDERSTAGPEMVTCTACGAQIPKHTAPRTLAPDYALYFCASCCCEEWTDERRSGRASAPTEHRR